MAQTLFYCRPDENFCFEGTVSGGAVDPDYQAEWLVDGRAGRPVRCTATSDTFSVTAASAEVGMIAVCHHMLSPGATVTVGSGLSATITVGSTEPPDGIPLNPYTTVTPTSVTNLTFAVSGNSRNVLIGEIIAGKKRTLTLPTLSTDDRGMADFTRKIDAEFPSIQPYDPGLSARAPWKGTFLLTTSELDDVIAWFKAQRNGTRPSLVVPNTSVNDAWVCYLQAPQYKPKGPDFWAVQLTLVEVPRSRW